MEAAVQLGARLALVPDIFTYHDYRAFLRDWFEYLKKTDGGFSLRGLAKQSGISSAYMPMVLSGRRRLSEDNLNKIILSLRLDPAQRSYLRILCQFADSRTQEDSLKALERAQRFQSYKQLNPKEAETSSYLSNWHYVVIRELAATPEFKDDAHWLQEQLRFHVPLSEIEKALTFLKAYKFIDRREDGSFYLPEKQIDCVGEVFRVVLSQFHKKMFQLGAKAIEDVPSTERLITGLTMSLSPKSFEKVKALLDHTMSELERIASEETQPEAVYHVSLAGFPLTQTEGTVKEDTHELSN
ncbi:MAG TPA: TIGR02147 family protein [Bdellovibrionales bacterium]|nr:TIGR02147 family protein [Bdellovibrionales bacterium]